MKKNITHFILLNLLFLFKLDAETSFSYKIRNNDHVSSTCENKCKPYKNKHVDAEIINPEDCYRNCLDNERKTGNIQMTDQELEERTGKVKFYV